MLCTLLSHQSRLVVPSHEVHAPLSLFRELLSSSSRSGVPSAGPELKLGHSLLLLLLHVHLVESGRVGHETGGRRVGCVAWPQASVSVRAASGCEAVRGRHNGFGHLGRRLEVVGRFHVSLRPEPFVATDLGNADVNIN